MVFTLKSVWVVARVVIEIAYSRNLFFVGSGVLNGINHRLPLPPVIALILLSFPLGNGQRRK